MSRPHPRPGAEHARRLKEAQERAQAQPRADDPAPGAPQAPDLLGFLVGLVERGIGGPYRVGGVKGGHLLCLMVRGPDSAWVSERLEALKPWLLPLCKTPVQDGLSAGVYEVGADGPDYDENDIPF